MIALVLADLTALLHRVAAVVLVPMGLVPMDVPSPSPTGERDVYPSGNGQGFAAAIVPALFALGVIALFAIWLSSKPKRRR